MFKIIFISVLVLIFVLGIIVAWYLESKGFNGGVCPKCGHQFKHFDTDSQGGRGYRCEGCGHITWVSYPFVDRNYKD